MLKIIRATAVCAVGIVVGVSFYFALGNEEPETKVAGVQISNLDPIADLQVSKSRLPSLPQPEPAPKNPNAPTPLVSVGEIEIPKLGVRFPVYEGVTLTVIDKGPGHWPGSAEPGQWGNSVIAGHRVTHSHPFRDIDKLGPGDEILIHVGETTYKYKVLEHFVVTPEGTHIVNQAPGYFLTLFACHPPGSARYRYVVRAELMR